MRTRKPFGKDEGVQVMQLPPAALLVTHQGKEISMFQGFLPSSNFQVLDVPSDRGQTPGVHTQHSGLQGHNFKDNLGMFMFRLGLPLFSLLPDLTAVLPFNGFPKNIITFGCQYVFSSCHRSQFGSRYTSVSYTHQTLPTILRV